MPPSAHSTKAAWPSVLIRLIACISGSFALPISGSVALPISPAFHLVPGGSRRAQHGSRHPGLERLDVLVADGLPPHARLYARPRVQLRDVHGSALAEVTHDLAGHGLGFEVLGHDRVAHGGALLQPPPSLPAFLRAGHAQAQAQLAALYG